MAEVNTEAAITIFMLLHLYASYTEIITWLSGLPKVPVLHQLLSCVAILLLCCIKAPEEAQWQTCS